MIEFDLGDYKAPETLFLWWLADPTAPRLIGELRMARSLKGVSLTYAPAWLRSGFPLSEDLPLIASEHFPKEKETASGAVDDARPDRWGERVIRFLDKPPRLSVLDYLFYAGDERFGALGVSVSAELYIARATGPLPQLADVAEMEEVVQQVLTGQPVAEEKRRLITPGTTLGGARPKALIKLDGHQWVLKFRDQGEPFDTPMVEHATMTLAAHAGIRVAHTRSVRVPRGHAVAVRRFDRNVGMRVHAISANVALKAAGEDLGYPELAQLLRRRGVTAGGRHLEQMHELFRRMVFNILMDNTDDHEKNHALLMTDTGEYELAPAFDVVPIGQSMSYQAMRVGVDKHDSTIANALSECEQFGLKRNAAIQQAKIVCGVVAEWVEHFTRVGVSDPDIEALSGQIDRPFLLDQRQAYR